MRQIPPTADRFHFSLSIIFAILVASLTTNLHAAKLEKISSFGANPSGIEMFLYAPDKLPAHPAVLVVAHWCHGTAQAIYSGTKYASLADRYGFIAIYPNAKSGDSCWDVHSAQALQHEGGSDPTGIVSMVRWVLKNRGADSSRVYVTGISSGAMMTNVLLGSYPDIFRAGASFAGVPFSCFSGQNSWNGDCAGGKITKTSASWGESVRQAFPTFSGTRPRIQLWHGTEDGTLNFKNFGEAIKQWTNVLGVSEIPSTTEQNTPQPGWIRTRYKDSNGTIQVEAIREQGQPHNLKVMEDEAIAFMGLDQPVSALGDFSHLPVPSDIRVTNSVLGLEIIIESIPGLIRVDMLELDGRVSQTIAQEQSNGSFRILWGSQGWTGARLITVWHNGKILGSKILAAARP